MVNHLEGEGATFGGRFKEILGEAGMSQTEAAYLLGYTQSYISQLARNRRMPSEKLLMGISERLGLTEEQQIELTNLAKSTGMTRRGRERWPAYSGYSSTLKSAGFDISPEDLKRAASLKGHKHVKAWVEILLYTERARTNFLELIDRIEALKNIAFRAILSPDQEDTDNSE